MESDPNPPILYASTHHLKNNSSVSVVEGNSTISEGLHLTGLHSNNSISVESNNQTIQATKSDSQQIKNEAQLVKEKELKNANLAASSVKSDENNQQEKMKKTSTEISKPQEQNVISLSRKVIQAFASLLNLGDAEHVIVKGIYN